MLRGIDTKPAEAPERRADSAMGGVRTQWGGATPEEASEGGGKEPTEAPEGRADSAAGGVGTSTWAAPTEAWGCRTLLMWQLEWDLGVLKYWGP